MYDIVHARLIRLSYFHHANLHRNQLPETNKKVVASIHHHQILSRSVKVLWRGRAVGRSIIESFGAPKSHSWLVIGIVAASLPASLPLFPGSRRCSFFNNKIDDDFSWAFLLLSAVSSLILLRCRRTCAFAVIAFLPFAETGAHDDEISENGLFGRSEAQKTTRGLMIIDG